MKRELFKILNLLWFKLKGVKYGKNLRVYDRLYIVKGTNSSITIGDNLTFTSGGGYNPISSNKRGCLRCDANSEIIIGNNCGMSSTVIWAANRIIIGSNVLIGGDCLIMDSDRHSLDYRIRNGSISDVKGGKMDTQTARTAPVTIEDDVLIGAKVIILKGITIGARSIIGAGSVVTGDIPSDVIAAGNPCRIIQPLERV